MAENRTPRGTPCLEWDCQADAIYHGRCNSHKRVWKGVTRSQSLPKDWKSRRAIIMRRDAYKCYVCGGRGTEVDHLINDNNHSFENLKTICRPHHQEKSSYEGHVGAGHNARPPDWLFPKLRELGITPF